MYKRELEMQGERLEQERAKSRKLEEKLRDSINEKQQEIDDLNSYYTSREEELETKINDLLTRLQDQTGLVAKLQAELDEYEWYEEEEDPQRPPSARSQNKTHSRPPSTKPLDQYKYNQSMIAEEDTNNLTVDEEETIEPEEEEGEDEHAQATAAAAHNNYVSMTSLYATAQTSTASEVSNTSSSAIAAAAAANAVAATTTADPSKTYPLAEEAFLTEATSEP